MPPNQYNSNPYDFITNSQQPAKRAFGGGGKKARILVVIVGVIIFIVVAIIVNKLLSAGSNAETARLTDVAIAETELVRVSTLGVENAKARSTITAAATTKLSVQSSQIKTKALLDKRGVKSKQFTKLIATSKNSKTDAQLAEAGRNNRYDEAFVLILNKQLIDYQKLLKSANDSGKPSEKKVLAKSFTNAGMLLPKKADSAASTDDSTEQ